MAHSSHGQHGWSDTILTLESLRCFPCRCRPSGAPVRLPILTSAALAAALVAAAAAAAAREQGEQAEHERCSRDRLPCRCHAASVPAGRGPVGGRTV